MFPLILKAADEPLNRDLADTLAPQTQSVESLFPYDERLDEALSTLLSVVNRDGSAESRVAFSEFLGYVERLEKTLKHHYQNQPARLSWVEIGTITVN